MPLLHLQLQGEESGPDGEKRALPPQSVLRLRGPVAQVALHYPAVLAQYLSNRGDTLPNPLVGDALIDTGASVTCIDIEAAETLGFNPIDFVAMSSASHSDHEAPVYFAAIEILGMGARLEQRFLGTALRPQGLIALLGRDALAGSVLFYNGPFGEVTLVQP